MAELDALLGEDAVIVADASYASIWVANYLTARKVGQQPSSRRAGLAGLGWGACRSRSGRSSPPRNALSSASSATAGFAHSWAELETLKRHELPITLIVLNNRVLGYQKDAEDALFGSHTDDVYLRAGRPRRHR